VRFCITLRTLTLCVICTSAIRCASDSGVVPESQGNYFIAKQGATGFNDVTAIKVEALEAARRFCLGQSGPNNDIYAEGGSLHYDHRYHHCWWRHGYRHCW
jgi:hypothetical protein